eukprot:5280847-Pyramimonas_sp.AAC.1
MLLLPKQTPERSCSRTPNPYPPSVVSTHTLRPGLYGWYDAVIDVVKSTLARIYRFRHPRPHQAWLPWVLRALFEVFDRPGNMLRVWPMR